MFGMGFYEWIAFIGGYPTIFSTFFLFGVLLFAGSRAIYRHKDYKSVKFHIRETLRCEEEIKQLLSSSKPLTRWRFKRLIGDYEYKVLTFIDDAPTKPSLKHRLVEWRVRKEVNKILNRRRHHVKDQKRFRNHRTKR